MRDHPVLGITCGDPAGIGPEVMDAALHLWQQEEQQKNAAARIEIRRLGDFSPLAPGMPSAASAQRAWDALEEAAALALAGEIDGIVTGPVGKYHLHEIGFPFPGQTEFFAARAGVSDFQMVLTGGKLTVGLVTIHVPLREVPDLISLPSICRSARLLLGFLREWGTTHPRIAVAGLNPHAGESGEFGREEIEIIAPAIHQLDEEFPGVFTGPFPPDTVFFEAINGVHDAVLCLYHDQGLIPLKLHSFHEGVNTTVGLPFVRTSPDHGTAYALAGKGKASPSSSLAALRLAARLACTRRAIALANAPVFTP